MTRSPQTPFLGLLLGIGIALASSHALAEGPKACRVQQEGKQVDLCSPFFVFCLDTANGLRARSWENRLTGRTVNLGDGPELEIDLGLPSHPLQTPALELSAVQLKGEGAAAEIVFMLVAKEPTLVALVTYRWDAKQPVLRKFVTVTNNSSQEWNRLLNVRLGTYRTKAKVADKGQGFPLYLNDECFMSLTHPAGWATGKTDQISLRQYPGVKLAPGKEFSCMETVYGVTESGQVRKRFAAYVQSRSRRVVRGHDKPYAIFEPFGARPNGSFDETEEFLLDNTARLSQGQQESGCHFDFYSIDFWVDFRGDLKRCDSKRFPNGLTKITEELKKLGAVPGLWIDSGGFSGGQWSIGGNPAVKGCFSQEGGRGGLCRASEPIKSMYTEAFRHHIRENGVRLLKFDNLLTSCSNPKHEHLPGVYSTEAIHDALIGFLHSLDHECPDVFLMLYWGYRSPWWLLHGDTYFDSGVGIEAASPSDQPAPYARDSIMQKLDQAQWVANQDVPPLGKDSLGVWLSDWGWNSHVGKARWEGGMIMDLSRGSLLAQPWSDTPWLSPPERRQMAEFVALMKAQPECFRNSRFILGNPSKNEPYGYCCTDGQRAFLAIHNACWKDSYLSLDLNSAWGLPDGQAWNLYRWWPEPAKLQGDDIAFGSKVSFALRPFEIVLLEVVPQDQSPSLSRSFTQRPITTHFTEVSRVVDIAVTKEANDVKTAKAKSLVVTGKVPASSCGGTLVVTLQMTKGSAPHRVGGPGRFLTGKGQLAGQAITCRPVLGTATYPSCWQAWRIGVEPSAQARPFEIEITSTLPSDVELQCSSYFLPK